MHRISVFGMVGLFFIFPAQAQGYCQQLLNNVARLERDAVGQPRSQQQYML